MSEETGCGEESFITRWMSIAAPARKRITAELPGKAPALQQRAAEQAAILLSLENLRTFPFIQKQIDAGVLSLHGWYFDLHSGELLEYDAEEGQFRPVRK